MNTPAKGRREALCQYGMLVLGSAILAFGLYNVHQQSNITEGGILGLVLFLVWKDQKPRTAKAAGIGALVAVILWALWYVLAMAAGIGAMVLM